VDLPVETSVDPANRTVGQLVAETIRLYKSRFFASLPLGIAVAVSDQLAIGSNREAQSVLLVAAAPLFTLAYIRGCVIASGARPSLRTAWSAFVVGVVIFLPVGLLVWLYVLPALAWLALVGLSVPVALFEGLRFRAAMRRASQLATADFIHVLGGLATLVLVYAVSRTALVILLSGQAGTAARTALFLADLAISPVLFLGSALLYFDQKARLESGSPRRRRRDARLHHADESDRAGRPDAQVEPGPAARGES
jgi:hypothetical protein